MPAVVPSVLGGCFASVGGVCVPCVCLCAVCPFAVLRGLWWLSRSRSVRWLCAVPCAWLCVRWSARLGQRCRRWWSACRACSRSFVPFWAVSCICSEYNIPMPFSFRLFFLFKAPSTWFFQNGFGAIKNRPLQKGWGSFLVALVENACIGGMQ